MTLPTADQAYQRWSQGIQQGAQRYTTGVQNSADWAGNFTAAEQLMANNLMQAIQEGRVTRGVQNLGTAGWRAQTIAKAGNFTQGALSPQAANNYRLGYQRLSGWIQNAQSQISSMPKGTFAQNSARLMAYINAMHDQAEQFKASGI